MSKGVRAAWDVVTLEFSVAVTLHVYVLFVPLFKGLLPKAIPELSSPATVVVTSTAPVAAPPTPHVKCRLTLAGSIAEPLKLVGVLAVMESGVLPVLSTQNGNGLEATPGSRLLKFIPGTEVVPPAGQLLFAPMANDAVADVSVLFDRVTGVVVIPVAAKVIPPTRPATAPTVPIARTNGLNLKWSIYPPPPN